MTRLSLCFAAIIFGWTSGMSGTLHVDSTRFSAAQENVITDQALGVSFRTIGQSARTAGDEHVMTVQSGVGIIRSATASVSVSPRPYVDLPGSYGGRLYLDDARANVMIRNIAKIESVEVAGIQFRRELWVVYAGMGQWEGVINCYALHNAQYYDLALNTGISLGKPGEVLDGKAVDAESLRSRLVAILTDAGEPVLQNFNDLLTSFRILK